MQQSELAIKNILEQLKLQQNKMALEKNEEKKKPVDLRLNIEQLNNLLELCIERDLILSFLAQAQALVEEKNVAFQRLDAVPYVQVLQRVTMTIEFKLKWLKKTVENATDAHYANTMNEELSEFCSTPFQTRLCSNDRQMQSSLPVHFQVTWNGVYDEAENDEACSWLQRGRNTKENGSQTKLVSLINFFKN